ncbi:GIY-YIG nuclease family protein [Arcobacter peruensis]|uniref:GIY-YIG nuclease family protein n=1 Tax=Arcobacter peruensis TaxID=2320140 RepID=UPI000F089D57|nr:GIY-YIG nuclease family protein [Arcobacter peruensis]
MEKNNEEKLLEIFNNDPFGLLEVKTRSKTRTEDERLISSFEEINDFYEKNQKEPENPRDIKERKLLKRLEGFRNNYEKAISLKDFDKFNLLGEVEESVKEVKEITSIEDIFTNDSLGILENENNDIFSFNHTPKKIENAPEYVAKRKPCKDFSSFEKLFIQTHIEINEDRRKLHPFRSERDIEVGFFFVMSGVMGYVASVGDEFTVNKSRNKNTRLRVVFENGTESDLLLRSLSAALYKDGRMITELDEKILDRLSSITDDDKETGYIYILKSLSENSEIKSKKNLYKIGFSRLEVEERIKNAIKEPTYLMAEVSIVAVYKCFNMNPNKLEGLVHRFFGNNCLDIKIYDEKGISHKPKEWFIAPLEIIEQSIGLIISGDIIHYKYDEFKNEIVSG